MKTEKTWFWNKLAEIFENFLILCMLYAAVELLRLFTGWGLHIQILLIFALLCGVIYMATSNREIRYLAILFLAAVCILALWVFRSQGFSVEICVGFGGFFFCLALHRKPLLRGCCVLVLLFGLFAGYIRGFSLSRWLIAAVLLLVLREMVSVRREEFGISLMPLLLLMMAGVLYLPAKDQPMDWSLFVRPISYVTHSLGDVFGGWSYGWFGDSSDRWQAGYSDLVDAGVSLGGSNKEELYLSLKTSSTGIYLEGQTYGRLAGTYWEKGQEKEESYGLWYLTYLNALYQHDISPEMAACFSRVRNTDIIFGYLRTSDLIRPEHLLKISAEEELTAPGALSFEKEKERGYRYRVTYMDFDYANPYLEELLRNCGREELPLASYEELNVYSGKLYAVTLEEVVSKAEYQAYEKTLADAGKKDYLEVSGVTDRVEALAEQITADCETDFDKCKAIETFLRQYTYNTRVAMKDADSFIDTFLFETQEGYCVHYASAMVMLLRLNGIPARFADGYYCNYNEQNEEKNYVVTGSCAHAWPEAYISGYGWIRLEPTVVYYNAGGRSWGRLLEEDQQETVQETPEEETEETIMELPEKIAQEEETSLAWKLMALLLPVLVCLYLAAFFGILRRRKYRRFEKASALLKLHLLLQDSCWLIRSLDENGDRQWEEASLLTYGERLPCEELKPLMNQVVMAYYGAYYGNQELKEDVVLKAAKLHEKLCGIYKQEVSGYRQWMRRLALYVRLSVVD